LSRSIIFNGKFLAGPATGVQRVASEMIRALDTIMRDKAPSSDKPDLELMMPPSSSIPLLDLSVIATSKIGYFKGIPWEQFDLPRLAKGRLIVSLANLGPILASNAVTMIHDAQTFNTPDSYSRGFRAWYGFIQPILGRRNRRIFTVSEFSKGELVRFGVAPAEKIDVIYNGVDHVARIVADIDAASQYGLRPKRFVLGLANMQAHKNIVVLLKAFADPRLKDIDLVLFGRADAADLRRLANCELPPNVKTVGQISDATLRGLMESALCLAFPSRTEGFGLPPLEAMFVGCPAIVAPCGALPEVCGAAALYASEDDPNDWIENILRLSNDTEAWTRLSQKAVSHAAKFRWHDSAMRLLSIVKKYE
jgi:glycosyltransferase involved in cell wall biosynthesis